MQTKQFGLREVLTVTTGRLLTEPTPDGGNGIDKLYEILNWMTADDVYTHQLGRFANECKPYLLQWFPEFAEVNTHLDKLDELLKADNTKHKQHAIGLWLSELMSVVSAPLRANYDIPQIPQDDHDTIDPLSELIIMGNRDA
jgi:hypothetical protein